jgi:glyoxylase I family protein
MKIEHVGFNVENPVQMAQWYATHLGFRLVRRVETSPFTHFLEEEGRGVLIEIYRNPAVQVPSYESMDPLLLHLAFRSEDPGEDSRRLQAAGARLFGEERLPDGTLLIMLRDPWGVPLQLCMRSTPMLRL